MAEVLRLPNQKSRLKKHSEAWLRMLFVRGVHLSPAFSLGPVAVLARTLRMSSTNMRKADGFNSWPLPQPKM